MNAYVNAAERYMTDVKNFDVVDTSIRADNCDGVIVSHDGDDLVFTIVRHTSGDAFPDECDEWRGRCEDVAFGYLVKATIDNVAVRFDFCDMRVADGRAILRYHTNAMRDA